MKYHEIDLPQNWGYLILQIVSLFIFGPLAAIGAAHCIKWLIDNC